MYRIIGADGREYGPVSAETIRQWIAQGRANAETQVKVEGAADWVALSSVPEFADALRGQVSTPPPFPSPGVPGPTPLPPDVAERDYSLDIGGCIGRGWELVMRNFWMSVGASFVVGLIAGTVGLIAVVAYGGMYLFFLKQLRGQKAEFGDAFGGFSLAFLQLFLLGLVKGLLVFFGFILCIIPGIYLAVAWSFATPLVADKRMDFWAAMELSRKVVNKHWWLVLAFALVCGLVIFAGELVFCVGVFVAMPVVTAAWACAYDDLFCSQPRSNLPMRASPASPASPVRP
jgi:hypothetical protein